MNKTSTAAIILIIGVVLLAAGVVALYSGPLLLQYLLWLGPESEPARLFGSFRFAAITCLIIGLYLAAGVLIPLGWGHLKTRPWARPVSLALLHVWLVWGCFFALPLIFAVFCDGLPLLHPEHVFVAAFCLLAWPVAPLVLIRFYQSQTVALIFQSRDAAAYWTDRIPVPNMALSFLFAVSGIACVFPILLNGVFPLFGILLSGLAGEVVLNTLMVCLLGLGWGLFHQKAWAWRGALASSAGLLSSAILTFPRLAYSDLLNSMNIPQYEAEKPQRTSLVGWHFAVIVGVPLLIALIMTLFSRKYFQKRGVPAFQDPEAKTA
ncbi:MAG TPA: hypothetical protein VMZ06_06790 [Candidatus Bathyarchaeia archaeon]|nr:hypothetical protein [Candidatus Bathyarchaeia archaeon]